MARQTPGTHANDPGIHTPDGAARRLPEKSLRRTFRSLRHRNYGLYWFGQMISLTGSSMQSIGQAWLVLKLTHSAWQLGLSGALQALPILCFSLPGGMLVDRCSRRQLLLATQATAMLQALLFWLLTITGAIQIWQIYTLALLLGCVNCLDRPATRAFVADLVGYADLPNAVALRSSLAQLTRIIGPALGGVVIAFGSVQLLFLLNTFSFLAVLASLGLINSQDLSVRAPRHSTERLPIWRSLREDLRCLWRIPEMFLVTVVVGLVLLFGSNFGVVLPLLATAVLHAGATGFGLLSAAMGSGALLSALRLAWSNRGPTTRSMLTGLLLFGVLEALFALSRSYLLSAALLAGLCFAEETFATQALTALQMLVPDHLRGLASGVQILCFDGTLPLGYVLVGWLSDLYGASLTLLLCALLCLAITTVACLWRLPALAGSR
ncbi:MAG TPA: MFS transporter [Ktedonobacteraceae bacterium]|jgi:MFS family permease